MQHVLFPCAQLVVPVLFDQLQAEVAKLRQSGRIVEWQLARDVEYKDLKLVNAFMVK